MSNMSRDATSCAGWPGADGRRGPRSAVGPGGASDGRRRSGGGGRLHADGAVGRTSSRTLERLTDLIIPVENGAPGAVAAGCAAWIDTISSENAQLKKIYTDGLAWLDAAMKSRGATIFVAATAEQQTALLDQIAYRRNQSPELAPGIEFFTWVRRMTVDAFYTSPIGINDIDYRGNSPMGSYPEPTEQIAYVLKRVPTL